MTAERQKEVTKMKEYSVRYLSMKTLTSVCENGKTVKYTYEEAVEKAKALNARADVSYCKIYKGHTLIETVEKTVEETDDKRGNNNE